MGPLAHHPSSKRGGSLSSKEKAEGPGSWTQAQVYMVGKVKDKPCHSY